MKTCRTCKHCGDNETENGGICGVISFGATSHIVYVDDGYERLSDCMLVITNVDEFGCTLHKE